MKDAAKSVLIVLAWTLILPLVGYSIFGAMTLVPLLGLFLGPYLLQFIYAAGALPAFVTAAAYELGLKRSNRVWSMPLVGAVATLAWAGYWDMLPTVRNTQNVYVVVALGVTGALSAVIIPMATLTMERARNA